jgi:hypothetical protein
MLFRMGLAISLVSTVPEKVWYHTCDKRGVGCTNTNMVNKGRRSHFLVKPKIKVAVRSGLTREIRWLLLKNIWALPLRVLTPTFRFQSSNMRGKFHTERNVSTKVGF